MILKLDNSNKQILCSGDLRINLFTYELFIADEQIELSRQNIHLLIVLLERAPNPVSHDELIMAVWGHTNVSDESLKQRIKRLRDALGPAKASLVTERGFGYRWRDAVFYQAYEPSSGHPEASDSSKPYNNYPNLWHIATVCIIGLVVFTWLLIRPESLPKHAVRSTSESVTVGNYCDQADKYFNRFNPKDNQTAIDIWRNAIQAHPGYPCPLAGLAKGYAISHLRFGASQSMAQQALLLADNAIQLGPQRPDGYLAKGLAYQALGQYSLALEAYKQSSRKEPRWNMPVRFSAQVLERKGDLAGAYRKSVDAIAINHCSPMSYQELGSVLSILGFEQRADQAYTKAVQFKPDFFTARVSRAQYQLDNDRVDNAMQEAQKLIAEAPDFPATQQLLADIYLFAGDSVAASTHYRSLLSSAPRFSLYAQVRLAAIEDSRNEQLETTLRTLMQEQPEVREWPYYLALLNAQWNNKTIALEYLSAAVEKGWLYAGSTERDPVLASLAREPEFQAVLAIIKSRVKTAAEEVETLLSDDSASCDQFLLPED